MSGEYDGWARTSHRKDKLLLSLPCDVWTRIVVKEENLVLFPTKSCFIAIQPPAVDLASDGSVCRQGTSREEIKLAERMASILKDFEARQLEVDEDEQLEVVEEEEKDWDPRDELMDVERQASSGHMITFSGGTLFRREGYVFNWTSVACS
ncbi:unnamed protein product [Heligmosomoides polygyrus]|uniref:Uncharacterized protein n=1 Tax=Heligmosomoides polygyrus TaxID=6339 RepID=A0A183FNY3_HELPZ|nr:unnamed protein product [Heligmosomoides polygyrus]